MNKNKETSETWNKIAVQYREKFKELGLYNESYAFFCNSIPGRNAKILDVGCGPGIITKHLLAQRPDFDILGIDYAPNMIDLANNDIPNAHFLILDGRQIRDLTEKYDGIVCGFYLPYLNESEVVKFFMDCNAIMNGNASIYLSFVEGNPSNSDYQSTNDGDRVWFNYYTAEWIKAQLLQSNFSDLTSFTLPYQRTESITENHIIFIAKKIKA